MIKAAELSAHIKPTTQLGYTDNTAALAAKQRGRAIIVLIPAIRPTKYFDLSYEFAASIGEHTLNALQCSPYAVLEQAALEQYFEDARRWAFDVACATYRAFPYSDLIQTLSQPYSHFAAEAKRRGHPACMRIECTLCNGDLVDISEAQYDMEDCPQRWGDNGFFASFASTKWKDHLTEITRLFVEEFGYNWVVFEQPVYRVDIPGTRDRFHRLFLRRYPDADYPRTRSETTEYLRAQHLKAAVVSDFYSELTGAARAAGAEKIGVVSSPMIPLAKDTEAKLPAFHLGRLASLPDADFIVAPTGTAAAYSQIIQDSQGRVTTPLLSYADVLSHCTGKPVVFEYQTPLNDEQGQTGAESFCCPRTPTLCALAAAPNGLTMHWTPNAAMTEDQSSALATTNKALTRTGHQEAPVAFVRSDSAAMHASPHDYDKIWRHYWSIAEHMLLTEKLPTLTFSAEALDQQLAANPQIRLLVLEEHFPLTPRRVEVLMDWWTAGHGRVIVVIGSGMGLSADPTKPGDQPLHEAFPGLFEAIGIAQQESPSVSVAGGELRLHQCISAPPMIDDDSLQTRVDSIANINRIFGSGTQVLYADSAGRPVVTRWRSGKTAAYFCGFGASPATAPLILQVITQAIKQAGISRLMVRPHSRGVAWNETRSGYLIVANCEDLPATATVIKRPVVYWDVFEQRLLTESAELESIRPLSFRMLRLVAKRSKFYDIEAAVHVSSIADGAGRADVELTTGSNTAFILRSAPREVIVDSLPVETRLEQHGGYCKIFLHETAPGDHLVTLRW